MCQILQITLSGDVRSWPMQQISVLLSETIHSMNIDGVRSGVRDGIVHNGVVNEVVHRGVANDECSQFALLQRGSRGGFLVKAAGSHGFGTKGHKSKSDLENPRENCDLMPGGQRTNDKKSKYNY